MKESKFCSHNLTKAAGTLLLFANLALLLGCQGLSAGGTGIKNSQTSAGILGSNPGSIAFGNVTVGKTQTLSGTVTNSGTASVSISQVSISGAGYTLSGIASSTTLSAGQSANFTVQFAPAASGTSNGNLTVTSNASNASLTIPVSGSGTNAVGQLGDSSGSLSFGTVTVGQSQTLTETVTNSGSASVTISQVGIVGSGFTLSGISAPISLASGASTTFSVKFAPSASGADSGNVTVSSDASNASLSIPLSGSGTVAIGTLADSPSSLSFGSVTVGQSQSLPETITNSGSGSVTISQIATTGSGFSVSGISAPLTLSAGQSASFNVKFAPTGSGTSSGGVTITSDGSDPSLGITLSGTGTTAMGQLSISPSTLNLGSVVDGTSGTASGTITASGANVTVSAASTSNSAFSLSGLTLPVTISAGQSASFTITFTPTGTGTANATLTVSSNAQPATSTEALTGSGTAAPTHSVALSWNASTSPNISGYNIYRAVYTTSCGSYSKINSALDASTQYTDSTVVDGTAYCYAATAVNSSNEESSYSNIASDVVIPPA